MNKYKYRTDKFTSTDKTLLYQCELNKVLSNQYEFYYKGYPVIVIDPPYRDGLGWSTKISYLFSKNDLKTIYISDFNDNCVDSIVDIRDRKLIELGI